MPDNFRYLYNHCRHESETYDLTECRRSQIGYAESVSYTHLTLPTIA